MMSDDDKPPYHDHGKSDSDKLSMNMCEKKTSTLFQISMDSCK